MSANPEGTFAVADLIEYQPDSVVSRVLIKKPTGSLTLFACAAGQEISEHSSPYEAMVHVIDGTAQVAVGGEWHTVATNEGIMLPAGVPHALHADSAFKMVLVMIKAE